MICCPSAVNKCPFKRNYYSIFGKECLVYGNIMCCPFRMYCLAPYTVPLGPNKTVRDGASSHKIDFVTRVKDNINVKKYHNCIIGSKVTAIMLNGWILPIGWVALERACAQPTKQFFFFSDKLLATGCPVSLSTRIVPVPHSHICSFHTGMPFCLIT